jgi:hypothetical protein
MLRLHINQVTKAEAGAYFDRMDADKSGFITLDEWIGFYANFMVWLIIFLKSIL